MNPALQLGSSQAQAVQPLDALHTLLQSYAVSVAFYVLHSLACGSCLLVENPVPKEQRKVCQHPVCATPALAAGIESTPVASVLLMPGSLLVFNGEAYKDCLHGIDEVPV